MRVHLLFIVFLFYTLQTFSQNCPQPTGLYTDNYNFNSSSASVVGHWDSLLGTGVQHFLVNYKQIDSLEWNNLANLDSTSTSKIIGLLEYNTTYVWRVAAYCSENYQDPSEWSVVDTFTTLEYVECPMPSNIYSDNIIVTEVTGFADGHWDSMLGMGVDHFMVGYKSIDDTSWNYISNLDSTANSRTIGGDLEHENYYEWKIKAFCSQNQSYYSDWSVSDTFYIGIFVPQEFEPEISIDLSSLLCEDLTDINFEIEQGLNQPDIQSTTVNSNQGSLDLENLEIGQNVGFATAVTGINDFINNEYSLVVGDILIDENTVEIDLVEDDNVQFSFTIINLDDGGIELFIVSPADNNSYTVGNSLNITLTGVFINPSPSLLQFDVSIFSELNNNTFDQFDFDIDCEIISIHSYEKTHALYPNPATSYVDLAFEGLKTIKISDINGQLISSLETSFQQLDIKYLSSGIYFVEIQNGVKRTVEKLIVR
tara:strand:+ start:24487 stop:25932 length:1446 start_codon:yes stop_codon:yes gene_type:complete